MHLIGNEVHTAAKAVDFQPFTSQEMQDQEELRKRHQSARNDMACRGGGGIMAWEGSAFEQYLLDVEAQQARLWCHKFVCLVVGQWQ